MNATHAPQITSLGFGMQGLAAGLSRIIVSICERFGSVTYLEIGIGHGGTLAPVSELIRSLALGEWRTIGVDLPDGYSLNLKAVAGELRSRLLPFSHALVGAHPRWNQVTIYQADSQTFLRDNWEYELQLALIDGCHGKPCATNDFLNIENLVVPGGIVMFHDFGEEQVGQPQPHCPTGLDVRGACLELGLIENIRPRWKFIETLTPLPGGAHMGVFQKH